MISPLFLHYRHPLSPLHLSELAVISTAACLFPGASAFCLWLMSLRMRFPFLVSFISNCDPESRCVLLFQHFL